MDFDKLLKAREAKAGAADPVASPPPADRSKPGRKTSATSKRQGWKACTFYLRPETKARLERVLLARKLADAGGAMDQSEAVEEALQAWLEQAERQDA